MKMLITGADGQLGKALLNSGKLDNFQIISFIKEDLDITDKAKVLSVCESIKPDIIINCAAFTDVDGAESSPNTAYAVNVTGTENLVIGAKSIGAKLVHISTDFVFDGKNRTPYCENNRTAPLNVYGKTKLQGERFVLEYAKGFCLRTAWLYSREGKNFVNTIRHLSAQKESLSVVDDQVGSPTFTDDLIDYILRLCVTANYGLYHCTGGGFCSRFELAKEIVRLSGNNCTVASCKSGAFPTAAKRPAFSALDCSLLENTLSIKIRDWKLSLKSYFEKETP